MLLHGEMQSAIAVGHVAFDLRAVLLAHQRDAFGAAGDGAPWRDRCQYKCLVVPAILELMLDHLKVHQARMRAGAAIRLEARGGAAIVAIDLDCRLRRRWRWCRL